MILSLIKSLVAQGNFEERVDELAEVEIRRLGAVRQDPLHHLLTEAHYPIQQRKDGR